VSTELAEISPNAALTSAFWAGRAAGRHLVKQGAGNVVFFSSVSGLLAHAHYGPYAASKGGLNQMMRVMAREWAPHGVSVNAVAPAYTDTPLTRNYLDRDRPGRSLGMNAHSVMVSASGSSRTLCPTRSV